MVNRKRRHSLVEDAELAPSSSSSIKTPRRKHTETANGGAERDRALVRVENSPARSITSSLRRNSSALWKRVTGMSGRWSRSQARKENYAAKQITNGEAKPSQPPTSPPHMREVHRLEAPLVKAYDGVLVQNGDPGPSTRARTRSSSPKPPIASSTAPGQSLQAVTSTSGGPHATASQDKEDEAHDEPGSESEDEEESVPLEGGTEDQPIQLADSDDEHQSPRLTTSIPIPTSPRRSPRQFGKSVRRPPSRPNLANNGTPRQYSWLTGPSTSTTSTSNPLPRSPARRRVPGSSRSNGRHLASSGPEREVRERKFWRGVIRKLGKDNDTPEARKAREVAERQMLKISQTKSKRTSAGARIGSIWRSISSGTRTDKEDKAEYKSLVGLAVSSSSRTINDVLQGTQEIPFSARRQAKRSQRIQEEIRRQQRQSIEDIREKFEKQRLEDEARIRARFGPPRTMAAARLQKVQAHLANPAFKAHLLNADVEAPSLRRLKDGQWLNDDVINFYGSLIQARSDTVHKATEGEPGPKDANGGKVLNVHYFNSFFWPRLSEKGYEEAKLKRWTKKFDIFSKDIVVFPINLGNAHWTAAAINFKEKRLEYYDSLGGSDRMANTIFRHLTSYLQKEHMDKKGSEFDITGWQKCLNDDSPQQSNGSDCGVFTVQTLDALSRGCDLTSDDGWDFTSDNMRYFRQLMVLEIAQAKLEPRWPKET